jgi:arginine/lysine/ornithine decarboxylase
MNSYLDGTGCIPETRYDSRNEESVIRKDAPLLGALLDLSAEKRLSFHMPGHRSSLSWPSWLSERLLATDTTELPVSVDLLRPEGAALEAMRLASLCFGAGWTRFLTSGSTSAIFSLLAACPGRGGRILAARNCHQSVMHAAALLDLEIGWISHPANMNDDLNFLPQPALSDVESALRCFGKCDAIIITSPDYYGNCTDISSIARLAHDAGAVLLVDEAHGAHFCAAPGLLPPTAMVSGADACVQSAHKTLPALTPGALIHISKSAIDDSRLNPDMVENMLRVFHTSSPSYVIAASLDYSRWQLVNYGRVNIIQLIGNLKWLNNNLPNEFITSAGSVSDRKVNRDQTRLVIGLRDHHLSIRSLARALQHQKIDIEMQDLRRLVLIPSLDQPLSDFEKLAEVCCSWLKGDLPEAGRIRLEQDKADELFELDRVFAHWLAAPPDLQVKPGTVIFGNLPVCTLPADQAAGRIAANAVVPYPPGIPLVWPGERLNSQKLAFIRRLSENSLNLTGLTDGSLSVLV